MTKHGDDWLTELKKAESGLPADEFTFTDASTMGLDGFHFEGLDNLGVLEGARLPEVHGLSDLPDGSVSDPKAALDEVEIMRDDSEGLYLEDMLSEEEGAMPLTASEKEAASLANLDWLDPTQPQDPTRLPHPHFDVIPDLEAAWGVDQGTTGVTLVPNRDKEVADYEESLTVGPGSKLPGNKGKEATRDAVLSAIRQSHFGKDLKAIRKELEIRLGSVSRVAKVWGRIEQEHGLVGKVYIRASAFPGLRNGKWVKELRQAARYARYVITDDPAVADKLKMRMVADVPWEAALRYYAPRLKAAGYRIPQQGDPRTVLRSLFLDGPQKKAAPQGFQPVVKADVQAGRSQGNPAKPVEGPVVSSEKQATKRKRLSALVRIAKWVQEEKLTMAQAHQLRDAKLSPEALLKRATELVAGVTPHGTYDGEGSKTKFVTPEVPRKDSAELEAKVRSERMLRVLASLDRIVEAKLLTQEEAQRIRKRGGTAAEIEQVITAAVSVAGELRKQVFQSLPTKGYDGIPMTGAVPEIRREAVGIQEARIEKARMARDKVALAKFVKAKLLTRGEAQRILKLGKTAAEIERITAAAITVAHERRQVVVPSTPIKGYDGVHMTEAVSEAPKKDVGAQEARVGKARMAKVKAALAKIVKAKLLTRGEAQRILKLGKTAAEIERITTAAVTVAHERRQVVIPSAPTKKYDGVPMTEAVPTPPREAGFRVKEIKKLVRWARQQMTEGLAGKEFDSLLRGRFSGVLRTAAAEVLQEARAEHEGLSGFLYVDAAAYASPSGTKGCDKGALRHRATPVKSLLAMKRCQGCSLVNADGVCSNYNKKLVQAAPVKDSAAYQKQAIGAANAPDFETTAAMFNPNDFGLGNENLDDTNLGGLPTEELSGVLFGDGMEVE